MKDNFPLGYLLIGALAAWAVYTWNTDETRITHPNHKASSTYKACLSAADQVFEVTLEAANTDPSIWIGYESARHYAKTARNIALNSCNPKE